MQFGVVLYWLLFAHFLTDYTFQTDFVARAKSRHLGVPGVPWGWVMLAHCFTHAGMVTFFTGSILLGLLELAIHFTVDCAKCEGWIGFHFDQVVHVACKVVWALAIVRMTMGDITAHQLLGGG